MNEFYYYFNETRSSQGKKTFTYLIRTKQGARGRAVWRYARAHYIYIRTIYKDTKACVDYYYYFIYSDDAEG